MYTQLQSRDSARPPVTLSTLAQMKAYCLCIRNKMAAWNEDTYVRVAQDIQKSGAASPMLQQLAKECYGQTGAH